MRNFSYKRVGGIGVLTFFLAICTLWSGDLPSIQRFDFEGNSLNRLPKGWFVPPGIFQSSWEVVKEKSAPSGEKVLAQKSKNYAMVFNLCVLKDSNYKNLIVSTKFKALKGENDQGGGIVWRYQSKNNYYVARFNPLESNFTLYKVRHGFRITLLSHEGIHLAPHRWHSMKIEMHGEKILGFLDGKKYLEFHDDTFQKAGKVGLWTKSDAQTYFDDFRLEPRKD